jgi:hypothetical protein
MRMYDIDYLSLVPKQHWHHLHPITHSGLLSLIWTCSCNYYARTHARTHTHTHTHTHTQLSIRLTALLPNALPLPTDGVSLKDDDVVSGSPASVYRVMPKPLSLRCLRDRTVTKAYWMYAAKTNTRHTDIHTSMALMYGTRGSCD